MAKPNYSFEKRQRELAKKRKKEDKAQKKSNPGSNAPGDADDAQGSSAEGSPPAPAEGTGQV